MTHNDLFFSKIDSAPLVDTSPMSDWPKELDWVWLAHIRNSAKAGLLLNSCVFSTFIWSECDLTKTDFYKITSRKSFVIPLLSPTVVFVRMWALQSLQIGPKFRLPIHPYPPCGGHFDLYTLITCSKMYLMI